MKIGYDSVGLTVEGDGHCWSFGKVLQRRAATGKNVLENNFKKGKVSLSVRNP